MLGCGGGGDGLETLPLAVTSRLILGAALADGGRISGFAGLFEFGVASKGGLDAGLLEPALTVGAAEAPRDSPVVMSMNSLTMPSSLYVNCIGLDG